MSTYETDFYAWTQEQARLIAEGRTAELDFDALREELLGLGWSQRYLLRRCLTVVTRHLLALTHSRVTERTTHSWHWRITCDLQRLTLAQELAEAPALRETLPRELEGAYKIARYEAAMMLEQSPRVFPTVCPWSMDEVLSEAFLPPEEHRDPAPVRAPAGGDDDGPPVRPNLSMGDTLAGLHAVLGILLAYIQRQKPASGKGQMVDVAIYEAVFNMLEAVVPEYDGAGVIRQPSGSTLTGIVPTNTYLCHDGKYVIIGGNGDSIFQRLMRAADRPDMAEDPRLVNNQSRVAHEQEIDAAISAWTASLDAAEVLRQIEAAAVPAGPIYSVADMARDPHFQARGLFENVEVDGKPLKIPAFPPQLSATPGGTDWPGPEIGAHNAEILGGCLGLSETELETLRREGII